MNDVHLPRFIARCQLWSDRLCHCQSRSDLFCQPNNLYETATRCQMHHGRFKGFLPLERFGMIAKRRFCVNGAPARTGARCPRQNANSAPRLQTVRNPVRFPWPLFVIYFCPQSLPKRERPPVFGKTRETNECWKSSGKAHHHLLKGLSPGLLRRSRD